MARIGTAFTGGLVNFYHNAYNWKGGMMENIAGDSWRGFGDKRYRIVDQSCVEKSKIGKRNCSDSMTQRQREAIVRAAATSILKVLWVASGKSLLEIEKEKLLDPMGMTDTNFIVTEPERLARLAQPVPNDSNFRVGREYRTEVRQKWESASGGMVSTMADFSKFAQMLFNGGTFDGNTYLNPKTFELMASDHTGKGSGVERDYFYFPGDGFGMGLGLAVRTDPGNAKPPPPGSLGELKWDGASGCYMVIDRKQEMFFVLLEQTPSERQRVQRTLKLLIYEALEN